MNEFVNEAWKVIEGFPSYEVSTCGRIRNVKTGCIRKPRTTQYGYHQVTIYKTKRAYSLMIHRLVASAFLGAPVGDRNEINHIDGVKTNNHIQNLVWVTRKENMRHAWDTGLIHYVPKPPSFSDIHIPYKNSASGFRGVIQSSLRWKAMMTHNRKTIHIGTFDTPEEAHEAYLQAKAKLVK